MLSTLLINIFFKVNMHALLKETSLNIIKQWLRAANPDEREELARGAGTSVTYLYHLASERRDNPNLRLAWKLCEVSRGMRRGLPRITLPKLAEIVNRRESKT